MKIKIIEPWKEKNIVLVEPGSSKPLGMPSKTQHVPARRAVFEFVPKRDPAKSIDQFSILIISNPFTKQNVFIEGEHSFYISEKSGIKGFTIGPGVLIWSESYFNVPEHENRVAAIEDFERKFDVRKFDESWENRATVNRIDFGDALSRFYFSDAPVAGSGVVLPKIEEIDVTDNILRLEIRNPVRNISATVWIDLKQKQVIRSVVAGKEMDLSSIGTNKTYADPLKDK